MHVINDVPSKSGRKIGIFDEKYSIFSKSPNMYPVKVRKQNSNNGNWDRCAALEKTNDKKSNV